MAGDRVDCVRELVERDGGHERTPLEALRHNKLHLERAVGRYRREVLHFQDVGRRAVQTNELFLPRRKVGRVRQSGNR